MGWNLVAKIESFHHKNWKQFPMVAISGNCFLEGEELIVRKFDPHIERAHHGVIRSL